MHLFWVKGFHATSLKDLEAALRMRPGSIYAAFESKEALFKEAIDLYALQMRSDLERSVATAESPLRALQSHILGLAKLSPCEKPSTACMLVKSLLELPEGTATRQVVEAHLGYVEAMLEQSFVRAKEVGELSVESDPARMARRMQTYIFGLKIQAQRESNPEGMEQLCMDLADEIGALSDHRTD